MAGLNGSWRVERLSGPIPPGVRKEIAGARGATFVGPIRVPFVVEGLTIRYRGLLQAFADVLEPDGDAFLGRATAFGREYGRFRLSRIS